LWKNSPGFATSRLGICLALEAMRMLEQKVADIKDPDSAMALGLWPPYGALDAYRLGRS
jgi:3-hydroxybutyryl-CoA dehydrogenase